MINDTKCYDEKELVNIKKIGDLLLKKVKLDESLERLDGLGDSSHIFQDPIDVHKRRLEHTPENVDEKEVEAEIQ